MNLYTTLLKILEATLSVPIEPQNVIVKSARTESYPLSAHTVFETSIVERMVRNAAREGQSEVGWEVTYPSVASLSNADLAQNHWSRDRLDFGLGYIDQAINLHGQHLFQCAVEVKRWSGWPEQVDGIWYDVAKLLGYWHPSQPLVGRGRYLFVVFPRDCRLTSAELKSAFEKPDSFDLASLDALSTWRDESRRWVSSRFAGTTLIHPPWLETSLGGFLLEVRSRV